jgi:hypothetical protein
MGREHNARTRKTRTPEFEPSGADAIRRGSLPVETSFRSSAEHPVRQLRGPVVVAEGADAFLVYAVAGETGFAIARLEISE